MKCICGNERHLGTGLCRMVAENPGEYRVEIFDPQNELVRLSAQPLSMANGLAFVNAVVQNRFPVHFHWEEAPPQLPVTIATREYIPPGLPIAPAAHRILKSN
jgi:hypothetical protein